MIEGIRQACPGATFSGPIPSEDPSRPARIPLDVTRMTEDLKFHCGYGLVAALRHYVDWRRSSGFLE